MPSRPSKTLETFPNPHPKREYEVEFTCPEFTCVCPMTGQPDFATLTITYVPDRRCIELRSFKYYLLGFRNRGIFYEDVVNEVLDDIVAAVQPRELVVTGEFNVRGGIAARVTAHHAGDAAK